MLATEIAIADAPVRYERVDLDRQHVEQVRQRQPDGADLLPAGRQAVEDPPRDDEVRARVVVAERQAGVRVVQRRGSSDDERASGDEQRDAVVLQRSAAAGAAPRDAGRS